MRHSEQADNVPNHTRLFGINLHTGKTEGVWVTALGNVGPTEFEYGIRQYVKKSGKFPDISDDNSELWAAFQLLQETDENALRTVLLTARENAKLPPDVENFRRMVAAKEILHTVIQSTAVDILEDPQPISTVQDISAAIIRTSRLNQPFYFRATGDVFAVRKEGNLINISHDQSQDPRQVLKQVTKDGATRKQMRDVRATMFSEQDYDEMHLLFGSKMGFAIGSEFSQALMALHQWTQHAPNRDEGLKGTNINTVKDSHAARTAMLSFFMNLRNRHSFTSEESIELLSAVRTEFKMENFLKQFRANSVRSFFNSIHGELRVAFHYLDSGATVSLPSEEEDAFGEDLLVTLPNQEKVLSVQVKSSKKVKELKLYDLSQPDMQARLKAYLKSQHIDTDYESAIKNLMRTTREKNTVPIFALAPQNSR